MSKRIKFAIVSLVSLCKRGANRLPGLYKSEDADEIVFEALAKMDDQGMLTSLVYLPDRQDSQGHEADSAAIEGMAHSFMENGAALDVNHDLKPLEKSRAYVAESFIVQKGDPRFADATDAQGNSIDATGAWALKTKLVDPDLRKLYREEGWNGVSLYAKEGDYELEDVPSTKAAKTARKVVLRKQGKSDMDEEKLAELLAKNIAKALEPLSKRMDALEKSTESDDDDDSSELKIPHPSNKKEWRKYKAELKKREVEEAAEALADDFDLTTTEGAEAYEAALAKATGEDKDDEPVRHGEADPMALAKSTIYSTDNKVGDVSSEMINRSLERRGKLKSQFHKKGA